eukprot:scaffold381_cov138-Cylindrotheca_fusiformis.AAC.21
MSRVGTYCFLRMSQSSPPPDGIPCMCMNHPFADGCNLRKQVLIEQRKHSTVVKIQIQSNLLSSCRTLLSRALDKIAMNDPEKAVELILKRSDSVGPPPLRLSRRRRRVPDGCSISQIASRLTGANQSAIIESLPQHQGRPYRLCSL